MICDRGDVIIVPFPFVDIAAEKRRPSLILTHHTFNRAHGHSICAMITTAAKTQWPSDVAVMDLEAAGLPYPCVVRFKLFTLPNTIILRRAGALARLDRNKVMTSGHGIIF